MAFNYVFVFIFWIILDTQNIETCKKSLSKKDLALKSAIKFKLLDMFTNLLFKCLFVSLRLFDDSKVQLSSEGTHCYQQPQKESGN